MTLSFKTQINNKPTEFVSKIWGSMPVDHKWKELFLLCCKLGKINLDFIITAKIHTIRLDPKKRWKVGSLIHFVINNRTPNRFQFAPILPVKSLQKIKITYDDGNVFVFIDDEIFYTNFLLDSRELKNATAKMETLAKNDGFETIIDFFTYFDKDFEGRIINWTDFVYS